MERTYLMLAIAGAVAPYIYFFQFFQSEGFGLFNFADAMFVNAAAGGISADLLLSPFVFWLFMFVQL